MNTMERNRPGMEKIREAARRIAEQFHPERIILFGSYAAGTDDADSDADLLVVMEHGGARREIALAICGVVSSVGMPKDVFVASRREVETYRDIPGTIASIASRTGLVLYDQPT